MSHSKTGYNNRAPRTPEQIWADAARSMDPSTALFMPMREHAALEGVDLLDVVRAANGSLNDRLGTSRMLTELPHGIVDSTIKTIRAERRVEANKVRSISDARKAKTPPAAQTQTPPAPVDPDDWRKRLIHTERGQLKALSGNVALIFAHSDQWRDVLAYNEFTHRVSFRQPPPWDSTYAPKKKQGAGDPWTDDDDERAALWLAHHFKLEVKPAIILGAVSVAARRNSFNPVREYYEGLVWDGKERLPTWLHVYMGCDNTAYHSAVGKWWLISAVARTYQPGCQADHTLILEGKQGKGKSQQLRALTGDLGFTDDLEDLGKKDAVQQLIGHKIVELSELDSLRKADVGEVKAFLTRQIDKIRLPYGRHPVELPRQNVFAGSTNNSKYLKDETGNRRFWPVTCKGKFDRKLITADRDQLWAEAVHRYKAGEPWWPTESTLLEAIEEQQSARREELPWESKIAEYVEGRGKAPITTDGILGDCLGKPVGMWSRKDTMDVAACMRSLGYEPEKQYVTGSDGKRVQKRGFWVKAT